MKHFTLTNDEMVGSLRAGGTKAPIWVAFLTGTNEIEIDENLKPVEILTEEV